MADQVQMRQTVKKFFGIVIEKYTNPANPVRNFCKQKLAAPPSVVWFGALWFLKSEGEEEEGEGEHETLKTKKSPPLREGPNSNCWKSN